MPDHPVHFTFPGRLVFVGFGSIGQGVLPLVLRHIGIRPERITIVTADDAGRAEAADYGIKFVKQPLTRENYRSVLDPLLAAYSDILTAFDNGTTKNGLVTAVISGARPTATMAAQALRYAAVDGRVGDPAEPVTPDTPASLVPLVSQNWTKLFQWTGNRDGRGESGV